MPLSTAWVQQAFGCVVDARVPLCAAAYPATWVAARRLRCCGLGAARVVRSGAGVHHARLAACHTAPALGVPAGAGLALRKLTTAAEVASPPQNHVRRFLVWCVICDNYACQHAGRCMLVFIPLNVHVLTWEEGGSRGRVEPAVPVTWPSLPPIHFLKMA